MAGSQSLFSFISGKQNPYGFNFDNVTEEDIIKGAVESNVSVFLHGRSSEGKSARVKQLDPDCEIIYMRNATPDSLNGKSVYNAATGEMIDVPPTWYSKVKDNGSIRYAYTHGNLDINHLIESNNLYLISWDKSKIDFPISDIENFYRKNFLDINIMKIFRKFKI